MKFNEIKNQKDFLLMVEDFAKKKDGIDTLNTIIAAAKLKERFEKAYKADSAANVANAIKALEKLGKTFDVEEAILKASKYKAVSVLKYLQKR